MASRNVKQFRIVVALFGAVAYSVASLKWLPWPYVWIAGGAVVGAVVGMIRGEKKALWFNVAIAVAILGIGEAYFNYRAHQSRWIQTIRPPGYNVPHEILGWAPAKNFRVESAKNRVGDRLIYDVAYSIGPDRLRIAPSIGDGAPSECVLFFGGSITYGEGVQDEQTMPYRVGVKVRDFYRVLNFGFHGYGPNQMLALLSHEMEREVLDCQPKYAIYQAIPDHVLRSAGRFSWALRGPRFVIDDANELVWTGSFLDSREPTLPKLLSQLRKSQIMRRLFFQERMREQDIDLFVRIIEESGRLIQGRYPGSEFHIIYWDNDPISTVMTDAQKELVLKRLQDTGISVHLISRILPDSDDTNSWALHRYDLHPRAVAHGQISEYVVQNILQR